jgi:hypothetical protein
MGDTQEYPYQIRPKRVADTQTYDNEPHVLQLVDGDLLLIYRTAELSDAADPSEISPGHVSNKGKIVARISEDHGRTWSSPIVVRNHPDYDTRNQSVVYDRDDDRVVVFYRLTDAVATFEGHSGLQGNFFVESTDGAHTWTEPVEVSDELGTTICPFGGYARTTNGLIAQWYGNGAVEALFSTDGGRTWGSRVTVADESGTEGRQLTEPVPCAITENRIVTFGRDNETGDFFAVTSPDGGRTWADPVYFNPTGMDRGAPAWAKKTGANEVTLVWGDRTNSCLYALHASAQLAWQDPERLAAQPAKPIHEALAEKHLEDSSYPTFAQLGDGHNTILTAFYDEDEMPNVWLMSLY